LPHDDAQTMMKKSIHTYFYDNGRIVAETSIYNGQNPTDKAAIIADEYNLL
jgi:hypothetical protein